MPNNIQKTAAGYRRSETFEGLYRPVMQKILKEAHVMTDLEALARFGADRERVLSLLATTAVGRTYRTHKPIDKQAERLEKFAQELDALMCRARVELSDPKNQPCHWIEALGLEEETGQYSRAAPDPIPRMRVCALWAKGNAATLRNLGAALGKTEKNQSIMFLAKYIARVTGSYRDTVLARLLNAAHDACGFEGNFTDMSLKKMRQRYRVASKSRKHKLANLSKP